MTSSCRIACKTPHCTEVYEACIAHATCVGVELDLPGLRWASLKAAAGKIGTTAGAESLNGTVVPAGGTSGTIWQGSVKVANISAWHIAYRCMLAVNATRSMTWLSKWRSLAYLASRDERSSEVATRAVTLTWKPSPGYDFGCSLSEGPSETTCELTCKERSCLDAYQHCLTHKQCVGVAVHESSNVSSATLKSWMRSMTNDSDVVVVLNEADWRDAFLPKGVLARVQGQPSLLPQPIGEP